MEVVLTPTADEITVREVLGKFEADFAAFALAVENGEFALWVGSGISRHAPNLGQLIERAVDRIRERAIDPATAATYMPAFERALRIAEVETATIQAHYTKPLADWPQRDTIVKRLWTKYSRLLDIPIAGKPPDYILWGLIDVRQAFAQPAPPAAEHLCIAILILEGAVKEIASANWDGFIEEAVERLSGVPRVLQVVVDPDQLRDPPGRARLLKFHGCIVHASREPDHFRRFLTGSYTQIMSWPETADFAAMRNEVVALATNYKTLVLGLSIQDNNLQTLFRRAKEVNPWPWPCAPDAPAYVFCEDKIQDGQRDVLNLSYGDAYYQDPAAIHEATLLRAWAEKVLIALVLKLLADKLARLMEFDLTDLGKGPIANALEPYLKELRDDIADLAFPDPGARDGTAFVSRAIALWSRMLSLYRTGALPSSPERYEPLTMSRPNLIEGDANARATGLGRLGIALSLLQYGRAGGHWELRQPDSDDLTAGAMTACVSRPAGGDRPLFLVKSAAEAIALQSKGAFAKDDAIVVHGDDTWHRTVRGRPSPRRVRSAPGRTGRVGETHISLGDLLTQYSDVTTLQQKFVTGMML